MQISDKYHKAKKKGGLVLAVDNDIDIKSNNTEDDIVWSRRVRTFHWLNAALVTALIILGFLISGEATIIGLNLSDEIRESMIPYHISIGAIMACNFLYRLFIMLSSSDRGESIEEVNPISRENIKALREAKINPRKKYKYHNPVGRLMVAAWFVVLSVQIVTGGVLSYQHLTEEEGEASIVSTAYAHAEKYEVEEATPTPDEEESEIMELHESIMYLIILMLIMHVGGVFHESRRIQENLVAKMIKGK